MSGWYTGTFPQQDIVVSTRVRLARNLADLPFPSRMSEDQRRQLNDRLKKAVAESKDDLLKSLRYIDMKDVPQTECRAMVERHTVSPDFIADPKSRAVFLSADEDICLMVGEEDHLRIQVLAGGLQPEKAFEIACRIERALGAVLPFAYDPQLGFLTECPTNVGTGLRVSAMLHLPLLENNAEIDALARSVAKVGFTVRGMYGENSKSAASLYQLSNQITLGLSEKDLLKNVKELTLRFVEKERAGRAAVDPVLLEDRCMRSFGILTHARQIGSAEMMQLLSRIKLGQGMGFLPDSIETVRLFVEGQPNMIARKCGPVSPQERDIYRATFLRENLAAR